MWVASSVLKTQLISGSPSSVGPRFNALEKLSLAACEAEHVEHTIQSSRMFDIAIDLMLLSVTFRSTEVTVRPSLALVTRI